MDPENDFLPGSLRDEQEEEEFFPDGHGYENERPATAEELRQARAEGHEFLDGICENCGQLLICEGGWECQCPPPDEDDFWEDDYDPDTDPQ